MGIYRRCIQRRYLYTALALAWAVGVSAEQYGGGVMPQYGGADYEHDYGVRSPDASAALDYKYHEEPRGNEVAKFSEDGDSNRRRKWSRVERKREQEDTEDSQELEDNALESESRRGRRRRQRRGRNRRDEKRPDADSRRRPPLAAHRSADRPLKLHPNHQYHDNTDYRDYGNKYPDDETIAGETKQAHGRKPRQRIFAPPPPNRMPESTSSKSNEEFVADEDEDKSLRVLPPKDEAKDEFDYSSGEDRDQINRSGRMWPASIGRMRPEDQGLLRATLPSITRDSGPDSDVENPMLKWKSLKSTANYPEYNEYSAKNNENMQNRLPTFLRRPTTTTKERPRLFSAGNVMPWPGRRAGQLGVRPDDLPRPSKQPPKPTAAATITATRTTPPTALPKHPDSPLAHPSNDTALSMEDKSRLSILKKALLKENSLKGMTKKPPVLMQVSVRQVPTLVMVAHSTGDPWLRARVVSDDSPEVLNKVKRLMRQKLVARSKDIRELTDNWDETICDYIDVGMLDPMSASNEAGYTLTVRALLLCAGFIVSIFN